MAIIHLPVLDERRRLPGRPGRILGSTAIKLSSRHLRGTRIKGTGSGNSKTKWRPRTGNLEGLIHNRRRKGSIIITLMQSSRPPTRYAVNIKASCRVRSVTFQSRCYCVPHFIAPLLVLFLSFAAGFADARRSTSPNLVQYVARRDNATGCNRQSGSTHAESRFQTDARLFTAVFLSQAQPHKPRGLFQGYMQLWRPSTCLWASLIRREMEESDKIETPYRKHESKKEGSSNDSYFVWANYNLPFSQMMPTHCLSWVSCVRPFHFITVHRSLLQKLHCTSQQYWYDAHEFLHT